MRILIDIPDDDLALLNDLSAKGQIARAELTRSAISSFLEPHRRTRKLEAFGLWNRSEEEDLTPADGLAYQQRMRDEW